MSTINQLARSLDPTITLPWIGCLRKSFTGRDFISITICKAPTHQMRPLCCLWKRRCHHIRGCAHFAVLDYGSGQDHADCFSHTIQNLSLHHASLSTAAANFAAQPLSLQLLSPAPIYFLSNGDQCHLTFISPSRNASGRAVGHTHSNDCINGYRHANSPPPTLHPLENCPRPWPR